MHYPTYKESTSNKIHFLKNQNYCECGFNYNPFFIVSKKDRKKIQFRHIDEVNCNLCRVIFFSKGYL